MNIFFVSCFQDPLPTFQDSNLLVAPSFPAPIDINTVKELLYISYSNVYVL